MRLCMEGGRAEATCLGRSSHLVCLCPVSTPPDSQLDGRLPDHLPHFHMKDSGGGRTWGLGLPSAPGSRTVPGAACPSIRGGSTQREREESEREEAFRAGPPEVRSEGHG